MSTSYQIIVENESPQEETFYFFTEPAVYNVKAGTNIYTNSVGCGTLRGTSASSALERDQLVFMLEQQFYAGAQRQLEPPEVGSAQVGQLSQVEIDITSPEGKPNNCTHLEFSETILHLNDSVYEPGIKEGAFRIITPEYESKLLACNIGLSSKNGDGKILLTSFIVGGPQQDIDVQPKVKFYVQTGNVEVGTIIDFHEKSSRAAVCDASKGILKFYVTYMSNGNWKVVEQKP